MDHVAPLPDMLADRYRTWRADLLGERSRAYAERALKQEPQVMIIACCDSRVMISDMFAAEAGDFFVHRNIAALVPPHCAPEGRHCTVSTVEYAVTTLKVAHILVIGHTGCGGVQGAHDLCRGEAPDLAAPGSFVGSWLRFLGPVFETVRHLPARDERIATMERETVRFSLRNLAALPFVEAAASAGTLSLHGGLWDLSRQSLDVLEPGTGRFVTLSP